MGRLPTGSGSSFVPRSLLAPAAAFGHSPFWLTPVEGASAEDHRFLSAQFQHLVMVLLRSAIWDAQVSIKSVAIEHQMSADKLYRLMRGEIQLSLPDLLAFAERFPALRTPVARFMADPPATTPRESFAPLLERKRW